MENLINTYESYVSFLEQMLLLSWLIKFFFLLGYLARTQNLWWAEAVSFLMSVFLFVYCVLRTLFS